MHIGLLKLWWLLIIPAIVWWTFRYLDKQKLEQFKKLGTPEIIEKIILEDKKKKLLARRLLITSLVFIIIALLRPQWGIKQEQFQQKGLDIVLVMDVSKSMLTPDLFPSRLGKAKMSVNNILDNLNGDRVALVSFSGSATVLCPLTIDYDALKMFVNSLDTSEESIAGTNLHVALAKALDALDKDVPQDKLIILFTDGEDHAGGLDDLLALAEDKGAVIIPICVGTQSGQPIPLLDENGAANGYKKDNKGNVVISHIHPENLQKLTTNKVYLMDQNMDPTSELLQDIQYYKRVGLKSSISTIYSERFQLFLLLGLILLIISMML